MLLIEPGNGLANRLRVIDSGIALAKELHTDLTIDWILNDDLNCRFDKLFEPLKGVTFNDGMKLRYPFSKHQRLHYWYKSLKFDISLNSFDIRSRLVNEDLAIYLKDHKKIFISTGHEFFPLASRKYDYFKPKAAILKEVNFMCNQLRPGFIGIHIRRSDNTNAASFSPTTLFVEKIKSILTIDPLTTFFLSTDSPDDEVFLKNAFPGNIFSYQKILKRNEEKGIQDALVDILCLSRASKIYGSFYSSFSEAASYFSGAELIILKK